MSSYSRVDTIQRQLTPNRVKGGSSSGAKDASPIGRHQRRDQSSPEPSGDSESTTDDDDEDDEDQFHHSKSIAAKEIPSNEYCATAQADLPARSKPLIASPKKFGLVGGMHRKPSTLKETPFVKSPSPVGKQYTGFEANTAGESQTSKGRDLTNPNSPVRAKSKLGFIGGGNKGSQANNRRADDGEKNFVLPQER